MVVPPPCCPSTGSTASPAALSLGRLRRVAHYALQRVELVAVGVPVRLQPAKDVLVHLRLPAAVPSPCKLGAQVERPRGNRLEADARDGLTPPVPRLLCRRASGGGHRVRADGAAEQR